MKLQQVPAGSVFTFLTVQGAAKLLADGVMSMGGRILVSDVLRALQEGTMQLWAALENDKPKAVMLSEIRPYPQVKVLQLFGLAGEGLPELVALLPEVEAFAADNGCGEIGAVETRAGLELAVPGFRRTGVCLVKSIEPRKAVA